MITPVWYCVLLWRNYTENGGNLRHINHTAHWFCVSERGTDLDLCKYWNNGCQQAKSFQLFRACCLSHRVAETQCGRQSSYRTMHGTFCAPVITFQGRKKKTHPFNLAFTLEERRLGVCPRAMNHRSVPPESLSKIHDLDFNSIFRETVDGALRRVFSHVQGLFHRCTAEKNINLSLNCK